MSVTLRDRVEAVLHRMLREQVSLLIAASNGLLMLDRPDAVAYLTGYRSVGESLLLLRCDGQARLLVTPIEESERLTAQCERASSVATDDLAAALAVELAAEANLKAQRIAIAGLDTLPWPLAGRLIAQIGPEAIKFDDILYAVSGSKTQTEIQSAKQATKIAESGFQKLLQLARPGLSECDLAVQLNCYTKSLGADDNFLMLNASSHNRSVAPSSGRRIEAGDVLLVEFTPSFWGQFAQICRSVSIGPPSPQLREKYDLLVRAMWAGIEKVRPGLAVSEICRAIDGVLEENGYGELCRPPHIRRRGHGLGCGTIAPGEVAISNATTLEEGMIFIVHPNQYLPETGYLLCGEPVLVTRTGVEVLSSATAALGVTQIENSGSSPCA